jgi:hypothetical protein
MLCKTIETNGTGWRKHAWETHIHKVGCATHPMLLCACRFDDTPNTLDGRTVKPGIMVAMADQEVFRRKRQSPIPGGEQPFDDVAVDTGWYDRHDVDGGRVHVTRFGSVPAPATLSEFIRTVQQIASAANGPIYGWRGQRDSAWAVHSGAMRRVMRPWVYSLPTDSQRQRDLLEELRKHIGLVEARRDKGRQDDDPRLWWDMRTLHQYLLDEARLRGFDRHEGVKLCDLELLALLQHNGAATHLLDVTRDVTTALWFASEDPETTGMVVAFDESGVHTLSAQQVENAVFDKLVSDMQYKGPARVVGWIPRNLTPRILAQSGRFILSSYADQPWGSVQMASTYVWKRDVEREFVDPDDPRVFFIAVTPELKKDVLRAGKSGLLGVDSMSLFPDIAGFAAANSSTQDVPLLP